MKISKIIENPSVRILLYIYERSDKRARFRDLYTIMKSKGTLSLALRELMDDGLITRHIDSRFRPVKSFYVLTEKGEKVAYHISLVRDVFIGQ